MPRSSAKGTTASDPQRLIARIALAGVLLVLLVTASSAYMRLTAAGLGCADWPACYGRDAARSAAPTPVARLLHRLSASATGAVVLAVALVAFVNRPRLARELAVAAVLLALTLALALLGRATPTAQSPAVATANLLGGMLMAALLWWLALGGRGRAPATVPRWLRGLSALALAVLAVQLALGAMVSTTYSALACTTLPDCAGQWWPQAWSAAEFDPTRPLSARAGPSAAIHLAHRYGAVATATVLLAYAAVLGRHAPGIALAIVGLLGLQATLGMVAVALQLPLGIVLAHNFTALILLLALVAGHRVCSLHLGPEPRLEPPVAE
jgi:cytochrome c oxidase assembly protein subunit 15